MSYEILQKRYLKNGHYLTVEQRRRNKLRANRIWRANHPESVKASNRKQYLRIKELGKWKEYNKRSYEKHKAQRLRDARKWHDNNIEKARASSLKYYYKMKALKKRQKCIGCEIILKDGENMVCKWCLSNYAHKYASIN